MLFNSPDTVKITILRKAPRDWRGDPIGGEEFSESHEVESVQIDWGGMSSNKFLRDTAEIHGTLFMPYGSDVLPTDRIELPTGDQVVVYGKPFEVKNGLVKGMALRFRGIS